AGVSQLALGRVQVPCCATEYRSPRSPSTPRSLEAEQRTAFRVVGGSEQLGAEGRHRTTGVGAWQIGGKPIDDAAHGIGAVQHTGRSANDLDSFGQASIDRGTVFVAPGVVLESKAVLQDQNAGSSQPANHRLPDLLAGAQRAKTG